MLFFFFVLFILTTIRGINLHPMNYFLSRVRIFFVSPADGLPGGPRFDSPGVRDLLGGFGGSARELLTPGGRNAIRGALSGARPSDLSYFVFVCLFL